MVVTDKEKLINQVDNALNDVREYLAVDGGDVKVVDITDDLQVKVQWLGNCVSCSMSAMTMKAGVEHAIKEKVPQITSVVAINGVA